MTNIWTQIKTSILNTNFQVLQAHPTWKIGVEQSFSFPLVLCHIELWLIVPYKLHFLFAGLATKDKLMTCFYCPFTPLFLFSSCLTKSIIPVHPLLHDGNESCNGFPNKMTKKLWFCFKFSRKKEKNSLFSNVFTVWNHSIKQFCENQFFVLI